MERLRVTIMGRVQGVGFRYGVYHAARAMGLGGWVRNLDDGRVEAEFQGERSDLEKMLAWCWKGPVFAHVIDVNVEWLPASSSQDNAFQIRG